MNYARHRRYSGVHQSTLPVQYYDLSCSMLSVNMLLFDPRRDIFATASVLNTKRAHYGMRPDIR